MKPAGEPMERKSLELYVQTAAWTGGITSAASGAVLLALLSPETPATLDVYLKWLGVALLVALIASMYMQYHAILMLNAYELKNDTQVTKSSGHVAWSQGIMLLGVAVAACALAAGLFWYPRPVEPGPWTVVHSETDAAASIVVLSRKRSSVLRVLTRKNSDTEWLVCEVDPEKLGRSPPNCGGADSASSGAPPLPQDAAQPKTGSGANATPRR
jgi:hypothetical protein